MLAVVALFVLVGGKPSNIDKFGGLLLTIVVSAGGIVLASPSACCWRWRGARRCR